MQSGDASACRPELPVVLAGDAVAPRTLLDAVAEGARAGAEVASQRAVAG
jgi:hypothetical protein